MKSKAADFSLVLMKWADFFQVLNVISVAASVCVLEPARAD